MWVQFYSSSESYKQVKDLKNILCALAKEASNKDKLLMKRYFATACNYELLFWDMAYNSTIAYTRVQNQLILDSCNKALDILVKRKTKGIRVMIFQKEYHLPIMILFYKLYAAYRIR